MKMLLVTPGRLPVPALKGGAVETLLDLLLDYNEQCLQHEIHVAAIFDGNAEKISHKYKCSIFHFIHMNQLFSYISNRHLLPYRVLDYFFALRVVQEIKKNSTDFDCIVIQNELVIGYVMMHYLRGNYIYHAHNDTLHKKNKKDCDFLRSCTQVITISDFLALQFKNGAVLDNVVTVYNGIDTELFESSGHRDRGMQLRRRYGIALDETVVVFAGRLVPEKGIEVLLEAFARIPEEKSITLLILGASFFEESKENLFTKKLRTLCQHKKEKIIFTGYVKHREMPDYYSMADIGCIPSLWDEPFGLTVVEQMAMEIPVITTDAGAIPEIVNYSCGYVLSRNNDLSRQIASAIIALEEDKDMRSIMGKNGRKIVCEKFSQKSFCRDWFEVVGRGNRCDEVY